MTHGRERVVVRVVPVSTRVLDPEVEQAIDQVWAGQLAEATARGLRLADAPAYRLQSVVEEVRVEHHDRMLVADGLVRTTDDRYLLLSTPKVTGEELQLVGGTASPAQREITSADDLFAFMGQRVEGALGVNSEVVDVRGVTGLVRQEIGCVNVVFDVRLAVRAAEVRARAGSRLVVVPADEVRDFLARGSAYLPAVAGLL